jgi:hypothetical protein
MDQTEFMALCHACSVELGCKDADALGNTNIIDVDGVRIGLFFDEDMAPDRILCYIDIGKLPIVGREEILERILALNLLTGSKTAGVYGLDQASDTLIFVQQFLYPELMSGTDLAEILQGYSSHAISLKKNLLDPSNLLPVPEILANSFNAGLQALA